MIPMEKWKWKGLPGHFIGSESCIFRLCTIIDKYMISTVGAMYVGSYAERKLMEIGMQRHYETFVFFIDKNGTRKGSEIDTDSIYIGHNAKTSDESWDKKAEKMHMKMCKKYARIK